MRCQAVGTPTVGAKGVLGAFLARRVLFTGLPPISPPRLLRCLFSCALVLGHFVLGHASVPKATRHGSWTQVVGEGCVVVIIAVAQQLQISQGRVFYPQNSKLFEAFFSRATTGFWVLP